MYHACACYNYNNDCVQDELSPQRQELWLVHICARNKRKIMLHMQKNTNVCMNAYIHAGGIPWSNMSH